MDGQANKHHAMLHRPGGKKTRTAYLYDPISFSPPSWLQIPPELAQQHHHLAEVGLNAIKAIEFLVEAHSQRYNAMCPEQEGVTFDMHTASMRRLHEWVEDHNPTDPTPGPTSKLPCEALFFHMDQAAYATYAGLYFNALERFRHLEWASWYQQNDYTKFLASQVLNRFEYEEWSYWWHGEFEDEMHKWQSCLQDLAIPPWEEIVDEVYKLILERVQDHDKVSGPRLVKFACVCQLPRLMNTGIKRDFHTWAMSMI
ncbi:hypothetical protein N7462_010058 [Penicillium macrosclerotiorum]|uniref:uncharacterized protein n=1 Tax=Penicillium macrosclerotiorum TaxID=303699 RepID=UPI00254730C9|nr:uncharacterized protein N7462_010058 [Penicillium macrosclerotiorum]KAJ5668988.1 hypothetical protein N7462_010058 [Penicillium macrosclerotiorum]